MPLAGCAQCIEHRYGCHCAYWCCITGANSHDAGLLGGVQVLTLPIIPWNSSGSLLRILCIIGMARFRFIA
ncbi:MAG: hypothetical protein AUG49_08550 [Catenulispora sp. 13_1_20CM_3_70_7]|jgi:hypothetical protein|nr:MAG: hypothetical protein AUG49_08550 [Catenulispora sp. 13_1_20CM_3_70_7]